MTSTHSHTDSDADGPVIRLPVRPDLMDPRDPASMITNGVAPEGTGPIVPVQTPPPPETGLLVDQGPPLLTAQARAAAEKAARAAEEKKTGPRRTPAAAMRRRARPDPAVDNIPMKVRQRTLIPHLVAAIFGNLTLRVRVAAFVSLVVGITVAITSLAAFFTIRVQYYNAFDKSLFERAESLVKTSYGDPTDTVLKPTEAFRAVDIRIAFVYTDESTFPSPKNADEGALKFGRKEAEVAKGLAPILHPHDRDGGRRALPRRRRPRAPEGRGGDPRGRPGRRPCGGAGPDPRGPRPVGRPGRGARRVRPGPVHGLDGANPARVWGRRCSIIGFTGVALAAWTGVLVARQGLRPVEKLTKAAEHVAKTGKLIRIEVKGDDELARLGGSFNSMLEAVERSQERQRRLVADAGHELRTPLTSLRTNLDLLAQAEGSDRLSAQDKHELLEDVQAQVEELTGLVSDLVELARDDAEKAEDRVVDMADVVANAVERARRRSPDVHFHVRTRPWTVVGDARSLERAVLNLLDNAGKWSPAGGTVTVLLSDGTISVADEGPGIAEADLPFVFERFYRSDESRTMPGSGLGLAIVRQAAERHKGTVTADRAPQGGALMRLRLPHGSSVTHTES